MLNFNGRSAMYTRNKINKSETELYWFMNDVLNDVQLGIDFEEIFLYDQSIQICNEMFQHMFDEMSEVDE